MTPRTRVLLMLAIATLMMAVALTTLPQRARAADIEVLPPGGPQYVLMIYTEVGWLRYVTPKGYIALPQSRQACEMDRLSVVNLQQGHRLECRPAR